MGQKNSRKTKESKENDEIDDNFEIEEIKDRKKKKKKLKDFDGYDIKKLQNEFLGFRCEQCYRQLKIENIYNDNKEIYISFKCEKDHFKEKISLNNLLKDNRIIFSSDYTVVDDFCLRRKDEEFIPDEMYIDYMTPEFFYICKECKKIFYTTREDYSHQHNLIEYLYLGNKDYYNPNDNDLFYLDSDNYSNLEKKINEQNLFYNKLKELQNKKRDLKLDDYANQIKDEIDFINEIFKSYTNFHSEISYDNVKLLFNLCLTKIPENFMENKVIKKFIEEEYKDINITFIEEKTMYIKDYSTEAICKSIQYACKISEKSFGTVGEELTIYEIQKIDKKYNFKELTCVQEKSNFIHYLKNNKIITCDLKEGRINIYKFSDDFKSYEIIQSIQNHSKLNLIFVFNDNNFVYTVQGNMYFYSLKKNEKYEFNLKLNMEHTKNDDFSYYHSLSFFSGIERENSKRVKSIIEVDKRRICFIYYNSIYIYNRINNKIEKKNSLYSKNSSLCLLKNNILCYIDNDEKSIIFVDFLTFKKIQTFKGINYRHEYYETFENIYQLKNGKIIVAVNFVYLTTSQVFMSVYSFELKEADKGLYARTLRCKGYNHIPKLFEIEDNCFIGINEKEFYYNYPNI